MNLSELISPFWYAKKTEEFNKMYAKRNTPCYLFQSAGSNREKRHIELLECVDEYAVHALFARCRDLIPVGQWKTFCQYRAESVRNGCVHVTYRPASHGVGRVYAQRSRSLASFKRIIRGTLARTVYHDVDMENAHPRILRFFAQRAGLPVPCLTHYINSREQVLESLHSDRSVAKQVILALMMGGQVSAVEHSKKLTAGSIQETDFTRAFACETRSVAEICFEEHPEWGELREDGAFRKEFRCMSFAMQELEFAALECAWNAVTDRGWQPRVIIHDGFMVLKRLDATEEQLELDLRYAEQKVKEQIGIEIPFRVKPFTEYYDLDLLLTRRAPHSSKLVDDDSGDGKKSNDKQHVQIGPNGKRLRIGTGIDRFETSVLDPVDHPDDQLQNVRDERRTDIDGTRIYQNIEAVIRLAAATADTVATQKVYPRAEGDRNGDHLEDGAKHCIEDD